MIINFFFEKYKIDINGWSLGENNYNFFFNKKLDLHL